MGIGKGEGSAESDWPESFSRDRSLESYWLSGLREATHLCHAGRGLWFRGVGDGIPALGAGAAGVAGEVVVTDPAMAPRDAVESLAHPRAGQYERDCENEPRGNHEGFESCVLSLHFFVPEAAEPQCGRLRWHSTCPLNDVFRVIPPMCSRTAGIHDSSEAKPSAFGEG